MTSKSDAAKAKTTSDTASRGVSSKKPWTRPTMTSMDASSTSGTPGTNPTPDGTFFPAS